jgi:hypothetical protein
MDMTEKKAHAICKTCNRTVEILKTDEYTHLSCGHTNLFNGSFSSKSFTLDSFRYLPSLGEKVIANVSGQQPSLNISGEVKEVEYQKSDTAPGQFNIIFSSYAPNSFNSITATTNQSIFQYFSIENILTFVGQQNISAENRTFLESQIKDFEQECNKSSPDQRKLKSILNYVCHIAKDVGLMLIKYGLDSGQLKF